MDQFTAAITNKFRTSGSSNYDISQAQTATGAVIETTVCIKFDWEWLLFPILLVSVAGVLLSLMILQSYQKPEQPVWKTSLLPLLFYGPRNGLVPPNEPTPVPDLDDLDKRANKIRARWQSGMYAGFVETRPYSKVKNHDIDMDSLLGVEEEADRQAGRGELSR